VVPLTRLIPGQRASVLQLPARVVAEGDPMMQPAIETAPQPEVV
jgi:hypothetical protein